MKLAQAISLTKGLKCRKARIAAVGLRSDGTVVSSYNGAAEERKPSAHAEARLSKKLDRGAIVYVARTRKDNFKLANSKPCPTCMSIMKNRGVSTIYYSIADNEFGVIKL